MVRSPRPFKSDGRCCPRHLQSREVGAVASCKVAQVCTIRRHRGSVRDCNCTEYRPQRHRCINSRPSRGGTASWHEKCITSDYQLMRPDYHRKAVQNRGFWCDRQLWSDWHDDCLAGVQAIHHGESRSGNADSPVLTAARRARIHVTASPNQTRRFAWTLGAQAC